ncbi:TolC family protein, partial [Enterococcus lactis]|uniref:TolC family protein n=1 Tax=Enterococcus lactis TaxID=357441 RepID=UPI0039083773
SYHAPALNQLVEQALANNNDLAAAIARVREADASASIAGAPLLPTLQANFSDTRSYTGNASTGVSTGGGVTSFGGSSKYRTSYNARLQASY